MVRSTYDETLVETNIHAEHLTIRAKDKLCIPGQDTLVADTKDILVDKAIEEHKEIEIHKIEEDSKEVKTDYIMNLYKMNLVYIFFVIYKKLIFVFIEDKK